MDLTLSGCEVSEYGNACFFYIGREGAFLYEFFYVIESSVVMGILCPYLEPYPCYRMAFFP